MSVGASPAFTLVHALMACGGPDGQGRWCAPKRSPTLLFPVHALSKVLRGKRPRRTGARRPGGQAAARSGLHRCRASGPSNPTPAPRLGDPCQGCAPARAGRQPLRPSAPSRSMARPSSRASCSTACRRASSASATTGCSARAQCPEAGRRSCGTVQSNEVYPTPPAAPERLASFGGAADKRFAIACVPSAVKAATALRRWVPGLRSAPH